MDPWAIFTLLWLNVAVPVNAGVTQMLVGLQGYMGPRFQACVLLYLVIWWILAAYSGDNDTFHRFTKQLYLALLVYAIGTTAPAFNTYVVGGFQGLIDGFSGAVVGSLNQGQTFDANAFDVLGSRSYSVGLAVYKNLPSYSFKGAMLAVVVVIYWFLSFVAIVMMFSIYLISYVMTQFMTPWGAVFIPLYFFPATRGYYLGWLSVMVTGVLTQVFTAGLGAMFIFVLTKIFNMVGTGLKGSLVGQVDGGVAIGELMMLIVTAVICLIFGMLQAGLVLIASRIAHGAHAHMGNASLPRFGGNGDPPPPPPPPRQQPSSGSDSSPSAAPPREYAFNRSAGSAP